MPGNTQQPTNTSSAAADAAEQKRQALGKKTKAELIDLLVQQSVTTPDADETATSELARVYLALDAISEPFAVLDPDDCYVYTNKAYQELNAEVLANIQPGKPFEMHLRELLCKQPFPAAVGRESEWLEERLARHKNPKGTFELICGDGTVLQITETRLSDGSTVIMLVNISAQKQSDKALAESEKARALLLTAIDEIAEGIALFDAEDRLVLANKSWMQMNAAVADTLRPGLLFADHVRNCINANLVPEARGREDLWFAERMLQYKTPGKPFEVLRADGRVNLVNEQLLTNGGRILVVLNITEQKRLQKRLEAAVEAITDAFILYDADGNLVLCNSKFKEFFPKIAHMMVPGTPFETIFRESIRLGVHEGKSADDEDYIQARLASFFEGEILIERQLADGRWILISDRKTPSGEIVGVRTDISELKHREEDARKAEQTLLDAIESISDGFILWDADHRLLLCNTKFKEYYAGQKDMLLPGMRHDDLVQVAIDRKIIDIGDADVAEWKANRIREFRAADGVYQQQLADGRWIQLSEQRTKSGGIVGIRRDISELVNAEKESRRAVEAAERASSAKSEFLGNMSHELRTPLNAIIGFSSVMAKQLYGPLDNATYLDYAGDIQRSGEHLLTLIGDLLDISRIEAGEMKINRSRLEVGNAVRACLRMVEGECRKKLISVRTRLSPDLPDIFADSRHFNQILINILSNALKFTPAQGSITVTAVKQGNSHVAVVIADTGVGIDPANLELVLEPFGQVADTITRNHEGAGLGLAIVKSLVELQGGTLRLQSELGKGTEIEIRLPVYQSTAASEPLST